MCAELTETAVDRRRNVTERAYQFSFGAKSSQFCINKYNKEQSDVPICACKSSNEYRLTECVCVRVCGVRNRPLGPFICCRCQIAHRCTYNILLRIKLFRLPSKFRISLTDNHVNIVRLFDCIISEWCWTICPPVFVAPKNLSFSRQV